TQCVDVTIKRYFVDVDALDASPYLLLFPRSGLAALYGAMPRPLLALNPDAGAAHDKEFGPSASIDTVTDLLDVGKVFSGEPNPVNATAVATPSPSPSTSDQETTFV